MAGFLYVFVSKEILYKIQGLGKEICYGGEISFIFCYLYLTASIQDII